jgi:hypothetical protein
MKKKRTGFLIIVMMCIALYGTAYSQSVSVAKKVTITYTWSRIQSRGSNQLAIWIEDSKGNHIRTLFATHFTATGGYKYRPVSLSEWASKFDLKNATGEQVDAISGSTPQAGKQTVVWDGKDQAGRLVTAGKYIVRMEANIHNEDRMFFRAEVNIGGANQQTKGEITFSKPELANGDVLFKDVLIEYK